MSANKSAIKSGVVSFIVDSFERGKMPAELMAQMNAIATLVPEHRSGPGRRSAEETKQSKLAALHALVASGGIVSAACDAIRMGTSTFYRWMKADKAFAASVERIKNGELRKIGDPLGTIDPTPTPTVDRGQVLEILGHPQMPVFLRVSLPEAAFAVSSSLLRTAPPYVSEYVERRVGPQNAGEYIEAASTNRLSYTGVLTPVFFDDDGYSLPMLANAAELEALTLLEWTRHLYCSGNPGLATLANDTERLWKTVHTAPETAEALTGGGLLPRLCGNPLSTNRQSLYGDNYRLVDPLWSISMKPPIQEDSFTERVIRMASLPFVLAGWNDLEEEHFEKFLRPRLRAGYSATESFRSLAVLAARPLYRPGPGDLTAMGITLKEPASVAHFLEYLGASLATLPPARFDHLTTFEFLIHIIQYTLDVERLVSRLAPALSFLDTCPDYFDVLAMNTD